MDADTTSSVAATWLISREEDLLRIARGIVEEERSRQDYYGEIALKLVAFHEKELDLVRQYVEMKLYYPAVAAQIERLRPELLERWNSVTASQ